MTRLPRFQERVLANALGFVNNAFRSLRGAQRVEAKGVFARVAAVLLSFVRRPAPSSQTGQQRREAASVRRYPNGFNRTREEARRVRHYPTGSLASKRRGT